MLQLLCYYIRNRLKKGIEDGGIALLHLDPRKGLYPAGTAYAETGRIGYGGKGERQMENKLEKIFVDKYCKKKEKN